MFYWLDTWFTLSFFAAAIPIAYSAQREVLQKYKISHLAVWMFIFVSPSMISAFCFKSSLFISLYIIGVLVLVFAYWMISKTSKSMTDTGEIDAIAWLLVTTPPQYPVIFFKKAGQMTGFDSIGRHYRLRLLESLMPLLALLITSYHTLEHHTFDTHSPSSKSRRNFTVLFRQVGHVTISREKTVTSDPQPCISHNLTTS